MIHRVRSNCIITSINFSKHYGYNNTFYGSKTYNLRQSPVICNWQTVHKHRLGHALRGSTNLRSVFVTSNDLYRGTYI